jgi:hypothetical protein
MLPMVDLRIILFALKRKGLFPTPLFSIKQNPIAARLIGAEFVCLTLNVNYGFKWPANAQLKVRAGQANRPLFG